MLKKLKTLAKWKSFTTLALIVTSSDACAFGKCKPIEQRNPNPPIIEQHLYQPDFKKQSFVRRPDEIEIKFSDPEIENLIAKTHDDEARLRAAIRQCRDWGPLTASEFKILKSVINDPHF